MEPDPKLEIAWISCTAPWFLANLRKKIIGTSLKKEGFDCVFCRVRLDPPVSFHWLCWDPRVGCRRNRPKTWKNLPYRDDRPTTWTPWIFRKFRFLACFCFFLPGPKTPKATPVVNFLGVSDEHVIFQVYHAPFVDSLLLGLSEKTIVLVYALFYQTIPGSQSILTPHWPKQHPYEKKNG